MQSLKLFVSAAMFLLVGMFAQAGTLTANFGTNWNYLLNGVQGPLFDGLYIGNSDITYAGIAANQGNSTIVDQNITSNGVLQINSVNTDFGDAGNDDGVLIYKVVSNDFSVITHISPPFPNGAFNEAGLQARAFNPGGAAAGGTEDWVGFFRFDQFGFGHIIRNTVNGGLNQSLNPDGGASLANTNTYWTRLDRVSLTNFMFFQSSNGVDWVDITLTSGNATNRADFNNVPLQVGLHHSTFNDSAAGAPNLIRYDNFSISSVDFDAYAPTASPVTGLTAVTNGGLNIDLSWTVAAGSTNTLVVVYGGQTGTNANNWVRYAPASGFGYAADNRYGLGSSLLTSNENYVVFSGSGNSLTISNLIGGQTYRAVVYAFNGSGASANYNHQSATVTFTSTATPTGLVATAPTAPVVAGSGRPLPVFLNFSNGSQKDVRSDSPGSTTTYGTSDATVGTVPVQGRLSVFKAGTVTITVTNVFVSGGVTNTNTASTGPITVVAGAIQHRYSFNEPAVDGLSNLTTNFFDSVANATNGIVINGHTDIPQITWPGDGSLLFDSAISTYAQLPADLFTNHGGSTFEAWFNADASAANAARILDAGSSTGSSLFLNNAVTGSMAAGAGATTVNTAARPTAGKRHIVFVQNGANRFYSIYVDGIRLAVNTTANTTPENVGPEPNVYLGRSQVGNFNLGAIHELRTYNYPLDALTIATHFVNQENNTNDNPGTASGLAVSVTSPLFQDDTAQATATATFSVSGPINVTFTPNIVWSSSNTNIASVNSNGVVIAIAPGVCNITATGFTMTNSQSLTVNAVIPVMQHRWSFNSDGDLSDSVGGANGSPNNITFTNRVLPNGVTNKEVVLTPTGATHATSFIVLPNDLVAAQSSLTVEAFYTERTRRQWANLWTFGNSTARYIFMVPNSGANTRVAILVPGSTPGGEQLTQGPLAAVGVEHRTVYTYDSGTRTSRMYIDGALVNVNTNQTDRPRDIGPTQFDYFGRSQFGADPDFDGFINEIRMYNYPLSAFQVLLNGASADTFVNESNVTTVNALSVVAATNSMTVSGAQQSMSAFANWNGTPGVSNVPVSSLVSNWVSSNPGVLNVSVSGVVTAIGTGSATISGTFSNIVGTSASITVNAATAPTLAHRWSFTGDLTDSVGGSTGTNVGGAVVGGSTVTLTGATNSYVRLPGHLFDGQANITLETWALWSNSVGGINPSGVAISDFGGGDTNDTTATNNWFAIAPRRNEAVNLRYQFGAGVQTLHSRDNPTVATMHHLLFSVNSSLGQTALYLDGELKDRWPSALFGPPINPAALTNVLGYFGHRIAEVTSNLVGQIDEYRIWNGAMDAKQAETSYQLGPNAVNPLNSGAISSLKMTLVDPTSVVGLIQRPIITANFANVSNIDLTVDPGVVYTSANTNIAKVTAADTWGASRIQAVGAGTVNIVATYGGISTTNSLAVIAAPSLRAMHRWSFYSDASDSVGNASGEAFSAPITNNAILLTGTQVPMSYVNLPRDLIAGYDKMTIEVFSTPGNVGTFGRLFDFGDHTYASANYTGTSYLFLTSTTGGGAAGRARVAYLPAGGAEVNAQAPNNTAVISNNLAVTITIDAGNSNMIIYTNGIQAGTLTNSATMTTFPTASLINNFSWLGRSAFAGDANWNGTIDDFRIYYGIMPSNQVTANFAIGPNPEKLSAVADGSGNVVVSWADMPPFTVGWTLQRTLALAPTSWTTVGIAQVTNSGKVNVTVPIGATNTAYFRLIK